MKAIVLINCDVSYKQKVKEKLDALCWLKFESNGAYQFIAEVKADEPDTLREIVKSEIRNMQGVRSTLTLPLTSSWVSE